MRQAFAIFRNTLLETVRQPLYALVVILMCGAIAISPAFAAHIYTFSAGSGLEHAAERMIADLGLSTVLLAGLILAVFSSASVVSREIENQTALTVLSKSVSRSAFVAGKYLGVAAALTLASTTGVVAVLLTLRLGAAISVSDPIDWGVAAGMLLAALVAVVVATLRNYYRGRPWIGSFTLVFITAWFVLFCLYGLVDKAYHPVFLPAPPVDPMSPIEGLGITYDWEVARAGLLTTEAVLLVAGVAVAASTRLGTTGNFTVCAIVFLGGLTSQYAYERVLVVFTSSSVWHTALRTAARLWHTLLPNLQRFWMSDPLTREIPIPGAYLGAASLYALSYVMATLFFAAFLFQRREVS